MQVPIFIGRSEFALQFNCKCHLHLHHIPLLEISSGSGWFLQNLFGAMYQSLEAGFYSVMISLLRSLPGHHFTPWRCWGADYAALVSRSYKLLLLLYMYVNIYIYIHIYIQTINFSINNTTPTTLDYISKNLKTIHTVAVNECIMLCKSNS